MKVRMKGDYFECFESGSYRPLYFNLVYDVDPGLGNMLLSHGLAALLELPEKKADNKKEESNVPKPKRRTSKPKKPRVSDRASDARGIPERVKKRAKN